MVLVDTWIEGKSVRLSLPRLPLHYYTFQENTLMAVGNWLVSTGLLQDFWELAESQKSLFGGCVTPGIYRSVLFFFFFFFKD